MTIDVRGSFADILKEKSRKLNSFRSKLSVIYIQVQHFKTLYFLYFKTLASFHKLALACFRKIVILTQTSYTYAKATDK